MESVFSKEQFNLLFQNSKDLVFFMEKVGYDYKYVFINEAAQQLLLEDAENKLLTQLLPESRYKLILENYNLAVKKQSQVEYYDYLYVDGEIRKYESTIYPIFSENQSYILAISKKIPFDRDLEDKYVFMRSVFFNSFLATVLISKDGKLLEANPQFSKNFNININEVKGKNFFDLPFVDLNKVDQLKEYIQIVGKGKSLSSKLLTFIDSKKEARYFTATLTPLLQDHSENVAAIFIIMQEITQYLRQEQELKITTQGLHNFKRAINSAAEVSMTDIDGIIIDVNDRFVEQSGYNREELIGKPYSIINSKYHSKKFFENLWTTIKSGKVWRGEIRNLTKCGVAYWVDTTIIPLYDEKGNIQQFLSIHFNISEKKRMMTELRNVEHMFKMITDNTNDFIVVMNKDGIILYASLAYERKLGYKREELIGQFYTKVLSKESKQLWNDELSSLNQTNTGKIELIHIGKDSSEYWTECNYTVVKDYVHNQGNQIIIVAREITERKEFENELLFLAYHDALTQLPNRRYIHREFPQLIEKAKINLESVAVLYVDGDNFKHVNDHYGHDVGDEFIYRFGRALSKSVRSNDIVARIGGDEFIIILTGLVRNEKKRKYQLEQIIERIHHHLNQGWVIKNQMFTPTASIGVAFYPDHGDHLNRLLENSDRALCEIKLSSKNSYKIFD